MKHNNILLLLLLSVFSMLWSEEEQKGIVTLVDGTVKKKLLDDQDFKSGVKEQSRVNSRESYKTEIKSRAELQLAQMDIIRLAPKTTIDIIALYEEVLAGKKQTNLKLQEGDIWAQVNSADDENEFNMNTDVSAAAITGTNFRLSSSGKLIQMKVYHGEVKITNSSSEDALNLPAQSVSTFKKEISGPKEVSGPKQVTLEEWIYVVKNMQQITFDSSGKIISAGDFSRGEESENSEWVKWNRKLDRQKGLK